MASLTFVLPGPIETRTGGFIYDRRIIEGLRDRGHEVTVIELAGDFPFPDEAARQAARVALAGLGRDSLVVADGLALGALPDLAQDLSGRARLVALVHHPLALESGLSESARIILEEQERAALSFCRQVIVSSATTARTLVEESWTAAPVSVVEPGTDPAPVSQGSGGPGVELLCIATLIPRKGHLLLLAALAELKEWPWRLSCVGAPRDPKTAEELAAAIEEWGLAGRVELLGEASADALDRLYDGADVFVLPSHYEGFGMVITEAVMRGLPVVTTTGGALAQTLPRGCGLLSPPGDVKSLRENLRAVLSNLETRSALRSAALSARDRLPGWPEASAAFATAVALE